MNLEQKKVILQEIKHWKDSKLLPAEYCDFLANLYAEGDAFSTEEQASTASAKSRTGSARTRFVAIQQMLILLAALLLFLIFAFNFTLFPMPMQIAVLFVGSFLPYFLARRFGRNNGAVRTLWLSAAALLLGADGYYFLSETGQLADRNALMACMLVVCLLWTMVGGFGRSRMIASIGWGGMLLMFSMLLESFGNMNGTPYAVLHLYWLLPAALSLFLAYLLGRGRVYIAPVFFFFGLLAFFGPELRMLAFAVPMDFFVQAIVFLKLAVLVALLLVYRLPVKNWIGQLSH